MNGRARKAVVAAAAILGCAMAQPAHAMRTYVNYDSLVITAGPGETNLLRVAPHPNSSNQYLIIDPGATITPGVGCQGTPLGKVVICTIRDEYSYGPPSLSLSLRDGADIAKVEGGFYIMHADAGFGDDRLELPSPSEYGGYTQVMLGGGNDSLTLEPSWTDSIQVYGGDGNDTIDASDGSGGYYYGERGDDTITADAWVSGGEGADTLNGTGNAGVGTYFGDAGNDSISTNDLFLDHIDCGEGHDTLDHDEIDEFSNCEGIPF